MTRTEPIIAVQNVAASSRWYQQLLDCESVHGGDTFEILQDKDGTVILCLHHWGEHEHPTMTDPGLSAGNGLILFFRVSDLDKAWANASRLETGIEQAPHHNPNSGRQQFTLRDPDGYYLIVSA